MLYRIIRPTSVRELALGPSLSQNDSRANGTTKVREAQQKKKKKMEGWRTCEESAIDTRFFHQQPKEKHIVLLNNVPAASLTMDMDQSDKATPDSNVAFMDID